MKKELQDDISSLCSHLSLDRNGYRVFPSPNSLKLVAEPVKAQAPEPADSPSRAPENAPNPPRAQEAADHRPRTRETAIRLGARRALQSLSNLNRSVIGSHSGETERKTTICIWAASGGAGATTAAATLARAAALRQERILLLDERPHSLLPVYFDGRIAARSSDRCFSAEFSRHSAVHVLNLDTDRLAPSDPSDVDALADTLAELRVGFDRLIIDAHTGIQLDSIERCARGIRHLVLAVPDLASVLGLERLSQMLEQRTSTARPIVVLNKFDAAVSFHEEMRAWIENQFGELFDYVTVSRGDETSEALAEGLTVLDSHPASAQAGEWMSLAELLLQDQRAGKQRLPHARLQALSA